MSLRTEYEYPWYYFEIITSVSSLSTLKINGTNSLYLTGLKRRRLRSFYVPLMARAGNRTNFVSLTKTTF